MTLSQENTERDYFSLFQLEAKFDLDLDELAQRFRALQLEFHPDRFTDRPANERRLAASISAEINAGFSILSDTVTRAGYLLAGMGQDLQQYERAPMSGEFMMQQIRLREQLADLNDTDVEAHRAMADETAALLDTEEKQFAAAIERKDTDSAGICWVKMQYLSKFQREITNTVHAKSVTRL